MDEDIITTEVEEASENAESNNGDAEKTEFSDEFDSEEVEEEPVESLDNDEGDYAVEDFEYDEDGNIVIPESEADNPDKNEEPEVALEGAAPEVPDEKTLEISKLRREREEYEELVRDVLSKLGIQAEDGKSGLVKLAAEADEISPEEYLAKRAEKAKLEEAQRILREAEFQKTAQQDLLEIHAAYPETRTYKTLLELPNLEEFAQYREKGLNAKKAYAAANPDAVRKSVAEATARQSLNETKNHLKSNVPKGSKDESHRMTRAELQNCRELFPDLSDKEINELYRSVNR